MDNKQYLTVKQFAKRAGVSTQRVYQLLTKSLQSYCKTENGMKYIYIEGLKIFDKEDLQEVANDLPSNLQGLASSEMELLKETIEALKQQLTVKDEQLAAKDKQITDLTAALVSVQEQHKTLTDALTAAQALHAGTIKERLLPQSASSKAQSDVKVGENSFDLERERQVEQGMQLQESKGFFTRMFGKKVNK